MPLSGHHLTTPTIPLSPENRPRPEIPIQPQNPTNSLSTEGGRTVTIRSHPNTTPSWSKLRGGFAEGRPFFWLVDSLIRVFRWFCGEKAGCGGLKGRAGGEVVEGESRGKVGEEGWGKGMR